MTGRAYDVIVIGGGAAGLTTAALLGRRGLQVIVLEERERLGGLTSTDELVPGVRCDTVEHELGWIPPALAGELELQRHGLEVLHTRNSTALIAPGRGEHVTLYADVQRTAAALARHSPRDGAAWPAFAQRVAQLSGFLQSLYEVPAASLFAGGAGNLVTMLALGRKARALGRTGIFDLLRTLPMSIADLLDETFEHTTLKGLLAARGVTHIVQGPRSGATAFLFLHNHVGLPTGAVRGCRTARGGVGALSAALASAAEAHGVTIRTGVPVARIDVRDGAAHGVILESGEEVAAPRVVSSLDPRRTIYDLIDPVHVEPELSRVIGHIRMRGATAKINLVLDAALPLGVPNANELVRGPLVVAPSIAYVERASDRAKHGHVSDEPTLEIRVPAALDTSLNARTNHVAVSVLAQWAPYKLADGEWDDATRDVLGDRVLRAMERVLPGVTNRVVERQVLSPSDIEQEYGTTEGSLTHGELALDQILFMRPVPALSRYRATALEGLYLCGRGCHPGIPLAGAMLAAREVARAARRSEPVAPAAPPPAA